MDDKKEKIQGPTGESGATRNHQIQENENEDEEDDQNQYNEVNIEGYDDDVPQTNEFEGFNNEPATLYDDGGMLSPPPRNVMS